MLPDLQHLTCASVCVLNVHPSTCALGSLLLSLSLFLLNECGNMSIYFIFLILLCHPTTAHQLRFNCHVSIMTYWFSKDRKCSVMVLVPLHL